MLRGLTYRAYHWLWAIPIALGVCGCSWIEPAQPDMDVKPYYQKIRQWQKQIQSEGWSAAIVDGIMHQSRRLTHYEMELDDDWLTPRAFARSGFHGDCEDIAIFMMSVLKHLEYPYTVRVVVISALFADHALLKVELPDGTWTWYDSTNSGVLRTGHQIEPIVEFDERNIVYHNPGLPRRIAANPIGQPLQ